MPTVPRPADALGLATEVSRTTLLDGTVAAGMALVAGAPAAG